jgi:four helix bundle protein
MNKKSNSYKDLLVWQKSIDLVSRIYKLTEKFPKSEMYGLSSQMQRAAVAIPSNIAEGQRRSHKKEFIQFLHISYGSGAELETQLEICKRLYKIENSEYTDIVLNLEIIMKMLNSLIGSLKNSL